MSLGNVPSITDGTEQDTDNVNKKITRTDSRRKQRKAEGDGNSNPLKGVCRVYCWDLAAKFILMCPTASESAASTQTGLSPHLLLHRNGK